MMACEVHQLPVSDAGAADAAVADDDQDFVVDDDEGRDSALDTDGDGILDYRDIDSDNDGFSDEDEAGDRDYTTPPLDTDEDGTPDLRDSDDDGNGIADSDEIPGDLDRDGLPDYRDVDDDGDNVDDYEELMGIADRPIDSDGDGAPNYQDPDSDDDTILDGDEYGADTDGDGLPDSQDLDSDSDGIPDAVEAGDSDLRSPPINSDAATGDAIPDFRDPDSDADGLSDRAEGQHGTSPTDADSDGDGVSDLIEIAAGTDALDGAENPRTRGDFVFVVPYMEDPDPMRDTLEFRTNVQFADIYFLFDESGSMGTEIDALRTAVTRLVTDLTCEDSGVACTRDSMCASGQVCSTFTGTCIEDPGRASCLLSPWTGGGRYESEYNNILSLQPDPSATAFALNFPTPGATENLYSAVWGAADPATAPLTPAGCATPMPGRIGCPAFREDAVRILVAFTDEDSDDEDSSAMVSPVDVGAALRDAGITFIGVWTTSSATGREDLEAIARESGSFDRTGGPLVFDGQDSAVVPAVETAINEIVEGVPLRVTIHPADEPDDDGDALQFIDYLEVNTAGGRCSAIASTEDTDDDGHPDAFPSVLPGTPVCWDVVPRRNETVNPTTEPQVFRARLTVSGDGSPLDARTVYFLVPPFIPPPTID